jgi:hypothetical protein
MPNIEDPVCDGEDGLPFRPGTRRISAQCSDVYNMIESFANGLEGRLD